MLSSDLQGHCMNTGTDMHAEKNTHTHRIMKKLSNKRIVYTIRKASTLVNMVLLYEFLFYIYTYSYTYVLSKI